LQQTQTTVARGKTPLPLKQEVLKLKQETPDYAAHKKYQAHRKGYKTWPKDDLVMRLRTLSAESRENIHEVFAVFDVIEYEA
jgi:hypothetical protein